MNKKELLETLIDGQQQCVEMWAKEAKWQEKEGFNNDYARGHLHEAMSTLKLLQELQN